MAPPTAKQKHGSVVITVKGCASQNGSSPPLGSCTNQGNSQSNPSPDPSQVFLDFRVPKTTKAPHSFSATTGPTRGGPTIHFRYSAAYVSELQRLAKAPRGQMWVGYASQWVHYDSTQGNQNFTAKVPFGLSRSSKGKFSYQVVIGGRQFFSSPPPHHQPIDCIDSLTTGYTTGHNSNGKGHDEQWICVDDWFKSSLKLK
jgi:hypothetical protein